MKKINCIDRALTLSHASQSSIFSFNSVVHSVLLFVPFVQAMLFLRHLIFPILFSNVPKNRAMRSSHTHTNEKILRTAITKGAYDRANSCGWTEMIGTKM